MTRNNFLLILYPVLLLTLGAYVLFFQQKEKTAYFYNQKVFDQFKGKLELEAKLKVQTERSKKQLDSLATLIQQGRRDLQAVYSENANHAAQLQQELSTRYTADIWRYINEGVADFGKEKKYKYIFGASGNGSLMYADSVNDVTSDIVKYLNLKYGK